MSYDFALLRAAPGASAADLAPLDDPEAGEPDRRPLLPWDDAVRTRVMQALRQAHPAFEASESEISDQQTGVQIEFYEREAALTVPYWHKGAEARRVFSLIWRCLRTISQVGGAVVYDPQVGRLLDLARDEEEIVRLYLRTVGAVGDLGPAESTGPARSERPWWKFW